MKLKEVRKAVVACWSPQQVVLAAGAGAQQLDAALSGTSALELYSVPFSESGNDLKLSASTPTQHRFQNLAWSGAGVLVGGCDSGLLQFYSADKLMNNSEALLGTSNKHNGSVSALDVNPYQRNLVASGATESEIFIWDLHNTAQPMSPGARAAPYEPVQAVRWNKQVQHILGSTFTNRCVVWDLRKNEPIMKLSDSQTRTRWRSLAWHPNVATQVVIASEDDQVPVIQLWDLRLAASPLTTLEGHSKGVLSLSWSDADPDLLLSGGKDGRVLCWNPNNTKAGGELLWECSSGSEWVYQVAWCPRNPDLFSVTSFDAHLAVHSLLGGSNNDTCALSASNILESFGGAASLQQLPAVTRAPTQPSAPAPGFPKPPAWIKRPVRASFGFGGKLVTFGKTAPEAGTQKLVYISQVVSSPELVERAAELDTVLAATRSQDPEAMQQLADFCLRHGDASTEQSARYLWFFLRANFLPDFRQEALNLLGFKQDEIPSKFKPSLSGDFSQQLENNVDSITSGIAGLSRGESTETDAELSTDTSTDLSEAHTLIERKLTNLDAVATSKNVVIPNGEDNTSLICRAMVCGNLEEAVELCLEANRTSDALIIASLGSQELIYKVQKYHLNRTSSEPVSLLAGTLLMSRWSQLVEGAALSSWRHTLATILTHADAENMAHYCEQLGDRLVKESSPALFEAAIISYVCAGSASSLLGAWRARGTRDRVALTQLALLVRRAAACRRAEPQSGGVVGSILCEYAGGLAAQGCLQGALNVLEGIEDGDLQERLARALGRTRGRQPSQQYVQRSTPAQPTKRSHVLGHHDVGNAYGNSSVTYESQGGWPQQSVPQPPRPGSAQLQPQPHQPHPQPVPGGITSRSKYKVDPSVQSAPLYGQYNFNNPVSQNQPYPVYNTEQYTSASIPSPMTNNYNPGLNPVNPGPALNPVAPVGNLNPLNPNPNALNGGYYNPVHVQEPAPVYKPAPPGWNDPPMMSSKPKGVEYDMSALHAGTRRWNNIIEHRLHPDEPKTEMSFVQPITHPLFGAEPTQHVPLTQPQQQYQQQQQQQQQQYQPYVANYPQQSSSPAPPPQVVHEVVEKAPLSDEHVVLQRQLDQLRENCSLAANVPQAKRKLEDVQRRLECLYDFIREQRLSQIALDSLHTSVMYAARGEYDNALHVATSMATTDDFASVATFLPGLKMLYQLAHQMQVYIR